MNTLPTMTHSPAPVLALYTDLIQVFVLFEEGFNYVTPAGLEFAMQRDLPVSASQVVGFKGVCHHTQLEPYRFIFQTSSDSFIKD